MSLLKRVGKLILERALRYEQPIYLTHFYIYFTQLVMIIIAINPNFKPIVIQLLDTLSNMTLFTQLTILILILTFLIFQFTYNVSLIRILYLPLMLMISFQVSAINIIITTLTVINLIIDIMKNSTTLLFLWNVQSQVYNQIKTVFFALNIISILIPKQRFQLCIICIILYFGLLCFRIKNQVSIFSVQIVQQLWCIGGIIALIVKSLASFSLNLEHYLYVIIVVLSFLIYVCVRIFLNKKQLLNIYHDVEQLKKSNQFIHTMQSIFKYLTGCFWNKQTTTRIEAFLGENEEEQALAIYNKNVYLQKLYLMVIQQKDFYMNDFRYWSLICQLQAIIRCNIPSMMVAIQILKNISQQYSKPRYIFRLLQINKLQQLLLQRVENIVAEQQFREQLNPLINLFLLNDNFVEHLRKTTSTFAAFWRILKQKCNIDKKINQLIKFKDQVILKYQQLGANKSMYSTHAYMEYLYRVQRDVQMCYQICDDFTLSHFKEVDEKIFVEGIHIMLNLEGQIIKVGNPNIIGYHKQDLEGLNLQILLPPFVRQIHPIWMAQFFDEIGSQFLSNQINMLHQHSFCVDRQGHLKQISLKIKLFIESSNVRLLGVLRVLNGKQFGAFKKSNKKMIGSSIDFGQISTQNIQSLKYDQIRQNKKKKQLGARLSIDRIIQDQIQVCKSIPVGSDDIWMISKKKHKFYQNDILPFANLKLRNPPDIYQKFNTDVNSKILRLCESKLQLQKSTYSVKKIIIKIITLCLLCVIFLTLMTLLFINQMKFSNQRIIFIHEVQTMQLQSFHIYRVLPFIYYMDFKYVSNVSFSEIDYDNRVYYQGLITRIKSIDNLVQRYPTYITQENYDGVFKNTSSFLLFKTVFVMADWILTDVIEDNIDYPNSFFNYVESNALKVAKDVLPYYEELLLRDSQRFYLFDTNQFIFSIVLMIILVLLCIVVFTYVYFLQKDNENLKKLLLTLETNDLSKWINECYIFFNIISKSDYVQRQGDKIESPTSIQLKQNSSHSRAFTQMSLIQNSAFYCSDQIDPIPNVERIQTQTQQAILPTIINKRCKLSKWFLFGIILFTFSFQVIIISSYYVTKSHQNPLIQLMKSTQALKSEYQVYMQVYLELLSSIKNTSSLTSLKQMLNNYNNMVNKQLQYYNSSSFDNKYFNDYRTLKNNLDFSQMCSYLQCVPQYNYRLNSSYSSNVMGTLRYIQQIYKQYQQQPNLTISQLQKSHDLDYLVYSGKYYTTLFTNLLRQLILGIFLYFTYLDKIQFIFYYIMFTQTLLIIVGIIVLLTNIAKQRQRALKILNIFQEKSYDI